MPSFDGPDKVNDHPMRKLPVRACSIVCTQNPEWGTFGVMEDRGDYYEIHGSCGGRVLSKDEAVKFWALAPKASTKGLDESLESVPVVRPELTSSLRGVPGAPRALTALLPPPVFASDIISNDRGFTPCEEAVLTLSGGLSLAQARVLMSCAQERSFACGGHLGAQVVSILKTNPDYDYANVLSGVLHVDERDQDAFEEGFWQELDGYHQSDPNSTNLVMNQ